MPRIHHALVHSTRSSAPGIRRYAFYILICLLPVWFVSSVQAGTDLMVDPHWKSYSRVSGISGNVNSIGSDTLNNLMTLWAEGFRRQYPNVKIQIERKRFKHGSTCSYRRHLSTGAHVSKNEGKGTR